jgi:hypothetical protein
METMTQIHTDLLARLAQDPAIQALATGAPEAFAAALAESPVLRSTIETYGTDMARAFETLSFLCMMRPADVRAHFIERGLRARTLAAVKA